jgi:hypothetical protein
VLCYPMLVGCQLMGWIHRVGLLAQWAEAMLLLDV